MRGFFSLLTQERDASDYQTGIFVASSDPDITTLGLTALEERLKYVSLSFVAPTSYRNLIPPRSEFLALETLKTRGFRAIRDLRARQLDFCVVLLTGQPTFRKAKIAALLLKTRRLYIFNEECELVALDRSHLGYVFWHLSLRFGRKVKKLLFPFGFLYLLWHTARLRLGRLQRPGTKS